MTQAIVLVMPKATTGWQASVFVHDVTLLLLTVR